MSRTQIKLLLIDDDEDCYVQLKAMLGKIERSSYHLDWACLATEGIKQIQAAEHDVYLVDYRLGGADGLSVIRDAGPRETSAPFIILTGQADFDVDVAAMELGASDYLEKGHLSPDTLERSLRYALERHEASTELERINRQLSMKNEELQNFVYTVSHDLKSPVVTLAGFAGHFKRDIELGRTDRLMMFADRFHTAAQRMQQNVDDLLELSRAGVIADTLLEVNVRLLACNAISELRTIADKHNVKFEIADPMPTVIADGKRVRRAILELVSNAIHHGGGTGATLIHVGTADRGDRVVYFVHNNGECIPPEDQSRIFDLFQRISHRSGGNGMGLALVRRIAEAHKGRAWVESDNDKGTTFYIELPKRGVFMGKNAA